MGFYLLPVHADVAPAMSTSLVCFHSPSHSSAHSNANASCRSRPSAEMVEATRHAMLMRHLLWTQVKLKRELNCAIELHVRCFKGHNGMIGRAQSECLNTGARKTVAWGQCNEIPNAFHLRKTWRDSRSITSGC